MTESSRIASWAAATRRPGRHTGWAAVLRAALPQFALPQVEDRKRVHGDLVDPDPAAADELVRLGATVAEHHPELPGHPWTVLRDRRTARRRTVSRAGISRGRRMGRGDAAVRRRAGRPCAAQLGSDVVVTSPSEVRDDPRETAAAVVTTYQGEAVPS